MLTTSKKKKLLTQLKAYQKKYFGKKLGDLDESGTRLMINDVLSTVLGYEPIEEIKTEYLIRGTYADYVIQLKGTRHFLVEVKALTLQLSDKHLRQAVDYGAREGIDWAVLTNGRDIELYRIVFGKPIDYKLVFKVDMSDMTKTKDTVEDLQFLHRDSISKKGLEFLWNKFSALEPSTIAGLLFNNSVLKILKRELKRKYKSKFEESEIKEALTEAICNPIDIEKVKITTGPRKQKNKVKRPDNVAIDTIPMPEKQSLN